MCQFETVGVIRNKAEFNEEQLDIFSNQLKVLRGQSAWRKNDILDLYYGLLPDFYHKETGKYLDEKM